MRALLWIAILLGIFITFAWPYAVSRDPSSGALMWIARLDLLAFLAALAMMLVKRARRT
jgi:hypothetical protein